MRRRSARPLSKDERAGGARNHPQPKKPTWDDRSAPASSRLTSAVVSTARDPLQTSGSFAVRPVLVVHFQQSNRTQDHPNAIGIILLPDMHLNRLR
jgi:hypothetical protein